MRTRHQILRVGDPERPLRARLLIGLTGLSLVGAGPLLSGALASPVLAAEPPPCGQAPTSPVPTFFTDEVGQPPVAAPDAPNHYTLTAHKGTHSFNSAWPAVPTLGYSTANATVNYLGPTIVTKKGTPIDVTIKNALPAAGTPMFPQFDETTHSNVTVLHRHGGLQAALSDGTPDQNVVPGGTRTNHYPNDQAAAPLWYHDHGDGVTSYNVYAGLAGFMPNTDALETAYNMPTGNFAKAYVLQDKSFDPATKALCYTHASPEFFGDLPVINGTIAPKQTVEPRRYTFTFINGSDSRFYNLTLKPAAGTTGVAPQMTVVGSDSGYVLKPAKVNAQLIAPGERYKVIVDFTGRTGRWVLSNDAATPYPGGDEGVATVPSLMRFDVGTKVTSVDRSSVPSTIVETNNIVPPALSLLTARLRTVQAGEIEPGMPLLGNATRLLDFPAPATETPKLGSTEAWAMRNHSPDSHPIHEHLVELRMVGRWPVTLWGPQDPTTGNAVPLTVGAFQAPGAFESGPKDTFVSPPDFITVWVGQYTIGGTSVWHCHILSHEDGAMVMMMRPLVVGTATQTQLPVVLTQARLDQLIRQP
jgi:spore coat protein A, manganese oxidase